MPAGRLPAPPSPAGLAGGATPELRRGEVELPACVVGATSGAAAPDPLRRHRSDH